MKNVLCLYVDLSTRRIVRLIRDVEYEFIPADLPGYQVKYRYQRSTDTDFLNNPYMYVYDVAFGLVHQPIGVLDTETQDILLLNRKLASIEFVWKTAQIFLKTCVNNYFHTDMALDAINYEFENNLTTEEDSLSSFLMKEKTLTENSFTNLYDVKRKFLYEKTKDVYKIVYKSQEVIFNSPEPEAEMLLELKKHYYLF